MTSKFDKRLSAMEQKLNPPLKLLVVIPRKDEARNNALARVMQEHGITQLPDECVVYMINLFKTGF